MLSSHNEVCENEHAGQKEIPRMIMRACISLVFFFFFLFLLVGCVCLGFF